MHPRLFISLDFIEPVIVPDTFSGHGPMLSLLSLKRRRDTWPSRIEAPKAARKAHKRWDSRVFSRWAEHGYRDLSRNNVHHDSYPNHVDSPGALVSSKYQEVMQYKRPNFTGHKLLGQEETACLPSHDPLIQPDVIGPPHKISPFYRSKPVIAWNLLDHVRPSVMYVIGDRSSNQTNNIRAELLHGTGAGVGGSGGAGRGQVKEVVIENEGHQVPLELVQGTASKIGEWISPVVQRWKEEEEHVA